MLGGRQCSQMGGRAGVEAEDEVEAQILGAIEALGSPAREMAARKLKVSRDVIDHMYAAPKHGTRRPMRLSEARTLAEWLGWELKPDRLTVPRDAPARKDVGDARDRARNRPKRAAFRA